MAVLVEIAGVRGSCADALVDPCDGDPVASRLDVGDHLDEVIPAEERHRQGDWIRLRGHDGENDLEIPGIGPSSGDEVHQRRSPREQVAQPGAELRETEEELRRHEGLAEEVAEGGSARVAFYVDELALGREDVAFSMGPVSPAKRASSRSSITRGVAPAPESRSL